MIDLTDRIKTGLPSAGISGIIGFDNVTESRTFFMTVSDLYTYSVDPNTGQSRYALNKAVKLGDTIYLYDGTSIFTLSQPEVIDFGSSEKAKGINILAKIKITPEILAMTYDEFQLKFRDISKSTDIEAFSRTQGIMGSTPDELSASDVLTQDNIIIGSTKVLVKSNEESPMSEQNKSYVADYICKTKFSEPSDLNVFSFDTAGVMLNSGGSSIEISPTKLSAEKDLYFNCPIDITSKTLDRDFTDFRSLEGADIKINPKINNSVKDHKTLTLQLNVGKSYNAKDFVLAILTEPKEIGNKTIKKYQFNNDKEYTISDIQELKGLKFWLEYYASFGEIGSKRYCQLHHIEFEEKDNRLKTIEIKKITKIDFEKNDSLQVLDAIKNPSDLYLTFDRVQDTDFYKGSVPNKEGLIKDSDLSVIHVALEKNKNKTRGNDIHTILIDGVSFSTEKSNEENSPKCYNSQISKIVTESDENIFSANIYINYDELKEYETISGYYNKIADAKGIKYPLNINDITISFVIGDKKYDYVIPGYQDYVVNNDYLIKPSISTNTEIEYINDFNCKNGFVNSLIMPYSVALDRLDVERLKSNGVTSVELDVVINDFVKLYTDTKNDPTDKRVAYKPLVVQEANLTSLSNRYSNSNDSYGYQGDIKFGLFDLDEYLKEHPTVQDKRRYVNALKTNSLDTPDEPIIRAANNRQSSTKLLVKTDSQTELPLTSFSVKFDLSKVDNYNFKKDFCIYLEFDNPIPSKVILNPHIAQIKFYFGSTSKDNPEPGWTRKLYKETTAISVDKSTSNKRIIDNKFVATPKPLSFNIFPIALTAAYTKQEDVDGLTDIRIDTNTRRVVGPAEKIKLSLYPLYPEEKGQVNLLVLKSLLTDVLKKSEFTASLNTLNVKSSHPVLKVAYNKFPLLPYNDSENETVEYNKKQYNSANYAQVNQNMPIFYPVDLNYDILEDKKFELKTKWLNEFNFLKSNNLLEGNIDLKSDYIVQSKSNGLMFLKDILDNTNELSGIKTLVNQELFVNQETHNYLDCELDPNNPLYLDKNIMPKDLFRAPLWDIKWEIPVKDDKSHDIVKSEGLDIDFDSARIKYHYANFFQMNSRILESNYPDEMLVLCLRRPTVGSDNLYEDPKNSMRYYFKATSYIENKYSNAIEYTSGGLDCPDIDF